jgi:fused signal recognition particle receptor
VVFNFFKRKTKETEQEILKNQAQLKEQARLKQEEERRTREQREEQERLKVKEQARLIEEERRKENERVKEPQPSEEPDKKGIFSRLKSGLTKTREVLNTDINDLFKSSRKIDDALFEELEEVLITADLGMDITMEMMDRIRKKAGRLSTADQLKGILKQELIALFPGTKEPETAPALPRPHIIMVVGVNGTGKTTTLGKLATRFTRENKKVLIAAADTFRAAAIEQVGIWADRAGATIVRHKQGADPAAVAYDGVEAAMARGMDVLLIDTAGRLHTQKNLMEELKKIKRTVGKKMPGAPHEVLMVLDATTGQNAISQAKMFHEAVNLTQLALTKLDGTAKGGIVAAVAGTLHLPIQYIGVGESMDDLQEFDAIRFVNALFD